MQSHAERVATARGAVDYITSRTTEEQKLAVPNCPGWTVYNAAARLASGHGTPLLSLVYIVSMSCRASRSNSAPATDAQLRLGPNY